MQLLWKAGTLVFWMSRSMLDFDLYWICHDWRVSSVENELPIKIHFSFNQSENKDISDIQNQEIKQILHKIQKCPLWISISSDRGYEYPTQKFTALIGLVEVELKNISFTLNLRALDPVLRAPAFKLLIPSRTFPDWYGLYLGGWFGAEYPLFEGAASRIRIPNNVPKKH